MKIAIFGVGAMASYYAQKLKPHSRVILLGHWEEQINALSEKGFNAYHVEESIAFRADLILVLTKSYRTKFYLPHIERLLEPTGHVLTLQNGLGNWDMLSDVIGTERCLYGITFQAVRMDALGQIAEINRGEVIFSHHPYIFKIARLFRQAQFKIKIVQNIEGPAWSKLIVNASINPITALFQVPNGELLKDGPLKSMALRLAEESFNVAQRASIDNLFFRNIQELQSYLLQIIDQTANNNSSMLQDKKRQNITEIDFINGAIIKKADQLGLSASLNKLIVEYMKMPHCPFFLKRQISYSEDFTPSPNN